MTYLEAINKVLRRLREDEVTSPDATAYSKLIGEFVNDSVKLVENSWDWNELRTTKTVTTSADLASYTVSAVNENFKVLGAYNSTEKTRVSQGTEQGYYDYLYIDGEEPKGRPDNYVFNSFADSDNLNGDIKLYPTPDKAYTLVFDVVVRTGELNSTSDAIRVAQNAVVQFAHAMAAEERGETGGTQSARLYQIAQSSLSDYIAFYVARRPTEVVWSSV